MDKHLYQKFFKSFLLVMLVPLIILTGVITFLSLSTLKQNIVTTPNNTFAVLEKELTYYIKQLNNSKIFLSIDAKLLNMDPDYNNYKTYTLINKLKELKQILGFCSDMGIINLQNDKVISTSGESSIVTYFDQDSIFHHINELSYPLNNFLVIPYETKLATRFLAVYRLDEQSTSYIFFTFDSYIFNNTISQLLHSIDGKVLITSSISNQLHIIYPSKNSSTPTIDILHNSTSEKPLIFSGSYIISFYTIPQYNLSMYIALPTITILTPLLITLILPVSIIILTLLLGLYLVQRVSNYTYSPIAKVKDNIPKDYFKENMNELSLINTALTTMNQEINALTINLNTNYENIKKSLLLKLIYQQYDSEKSFLDASQVININHLFPYYTITIVHCENSGYLPLLYEYLCNIHSDTYQCFVLNNTEINQLVIIFNFQDSDFPLSTIITNIKNYTYTYCHIGVTMGVSLEQQHFSQISNLFQSATQAIEYSFINGKYTITFANEFTVSENVAYSYIKPFDISQLEICILECNDILLLDIFYQKFAEIRDSHLPLTDIKIYLFHMINSIQEMLSKFSLSNYQPLESTITSIFMTEITIEDLFNALYSIIATIGKDLHTISDQEKITLIHQYIYDHFCDSNFSINALSDHFNISVPSLSRFYKKHQQQTLSNFIYELKIEKVKELLITTDKTIESIVQEIGYCNTSSFIRKFKSYVGMTPGQFRTQYFDNTTTE